MNEEQQKAFQEDLKELVELHFGDFGVMREHLFVGLVQDSSDVCHLVAINGGEGKAITLKTMLNEISEKI